MYLQRRVLSGKIGQQESLESRIYNSMPRRLSSEQYPHVELAILIESLMRSDN